MFYDYQPGNGTRYALDYIEYDERHYGDSTEECFILCWMKHGDRGGVCYKGVRNTPLHLSYLMEKMTVNPADGVALLRFLDERGCAVIQSEAVTREYEYRGW